MLSLFCTEGYCPDLFFCIAQKADPHKFFKGLYIADKHDLCRKHMGKYAVMFCDFKVCRSLPNFRQSTYMKQNIVGKDRDEMFAAFKLMVSQLYDEWREYLGDSLAPEDQAFFNSIIHRTTSEEHDWVFSLKQLSLFLARKSGRNVMVLIDEYEAPNNLAYESGFLHDVRPSPFLIIVQGETVTRLIVFLGARYLLPY